jgi:hypothetical protein
MLKLIAKVLGVVILVAIIIFAANCLNCAHC